MANFNYIDYSGAQGSGFKITGAFPIDVRQVIDTSANLNNINIWTDLNTLPYVGLIVSVVDEEALYMCTRYGKVGNNNVDIEHATWVKISGGDVDLSEIHKRISDVSQLVINVSTVLQGLTKAFIFRGKAIYNPSASPAADTSNFIIGIIDPLRGGDVYQTPDNKEWVYVDTNYLPDDYDGSVWIDLGSPYGIDPGMFGHAHIINASTSSPFVSVSTYTISENDTSITTIYVDVSTSDLDTSTSYATTGFVTDNQLKTYMSWVVLDSD